METFGFTLPENEHWEEKIPVPGVPLSSKGDLGIDPSSQPVICQPKA